MLSLCCCVGFSVVVVSGDYSAVVMCRLLTTQASLVVEHRLYGIQASVVETHRLQSTDSVVEVYTLNCPGACGIFSDQGSNQCPCIGRQVLNHWTTREV